MAGGNWGEACVVWGAKDDAPDSLEGESREEEDG